MRIEEFLNEEETITRYEAIKDELYKLELVIDNKLTTSVKPTDLKQRRDILLEEKESLTKELKGKPSLTTHLKVNTLIKQISAISENLEVDQSGVQVCNRQGLIFETTIYNIIIEDLLYALKGFYGYSRSTPYLRNPDSIFDSRELINYLKKLREQILSLNPQNYIELEKIISEAVHAINDIANKFFIDNFVVQRR